MRWHLQKQQLSPADLLWNYYPVNRPAGICSLTSPVLPTSEKKKKSLNWFVKMYALNGPFFHLTEKNTQITLNIDGTLSKRMLCTVIHLSWKDKMLFLPATEILNQLWLEQDAIKILRAVGLKTDYFIKLTTCRQPLNF